MKLKLITGAALLTTMLNTWAWQETPPPAPSPPAPGSMQMQATPPADLLSAPATSDNLPSQREFHAWILPVAQALTATDAAALLQQLRQANYPAYSVTTGQQVTVYVGPEVDQARLEAWRNKLQKVYPNVGKIQAFDPLHQMGIQS